MATEPRERGAAKDAMTRGRFMCDLSKAARPVGRPARKQKPKSADAARESRTPER